MKNYGPLLMAIGFMTVFCMVQLTVYGFSRGDNDEKYFMVVAFLNAAIFVIAAMYFQGVIVWVGK